MSFDERDVLLKAASIVEEGWMQGDGFRWAEEDYSYDVKDAIASCALGSIERAQLMLRVEDGYYRASQLLMKYLGLRQGVDIVEWNDTPNRTAEEVATAMREAANGNLG